MPIRVILEPVRAVVARNLEQFLEGLPVGVMFCDRELILTGLNRPGEICVGRPREELLGRHLFTVFEQLAFFKRDGRPLPREEIPLVRAVRQGETLVEVELVVEHPSGERHFVLLNTAPLRNGAGQIVGAVCIFQDVTAMARREEQMRHFLHLAAHELRTPLVSVQGYLELLLRQELEAASARPFLQAAYEGARKLQSNISNMLEMAEIEYRRRLACFEPVDLGEILDEVCRTMLPLAMDEGLKLECRCGLRRVMVMGEKAKLVRIFENLVANAIKYNRPAGSVSIDCSSSAEGALVQVADTGLGIPATELARIFERFYQVSREGKRPRGLGLGLAIVKEYVDLHRGQVRVESVEEEGSTFYVSLPLTEEPVPLV